MSLKELFLCHHSVFASEVRGLATELRLRGIVPWVDKQRGGFKIGDHSADQARWVIQDDCFGLLFYATPAAFDRWFIRNVEMPAAKRAKEQNPAYVLAAFLRGITFSTLGKKSQACFGIDLSQFHGISSRRNATPDQRRSDWRRLSTEVLRAWLALQRGADRVSLQYSTRQLFPDAPDDVLRIDATEYFANDALSMEKWDALRLALIDVQAEIAHRFQRPRIAVHGSKHLTAAFLFGRVFSRHILDIRQTPTQVWSSDAPAAPTRPFDAALDMPDDHDGTLFVQASSGLKNIARGVDELLTRRVGAQPARLSLVPAGGPLDVGNALCVAMAKQAYDEIERAVGATGAREIHLFIAAHQAFVMMLAQRFSGMPVAHFYEWDGARYVKTCVVPSGPAGAA